MWQAEQRFDKFCRASLPVFAALAIILAVCFPIRSMAQQGGQKTFSSPDEACKALVTAAQNNDEKAMLEIFGPAGKQLVSSGENLPVIRSCPTHRTGIKPPRDQCSRSAGANSYRSGGQTVSFRRGGQVHVDSAAVDTDRKVGAVRSQSISRGERYRSNYPGSGVTTREIVPVLRFTHPPRMPSIVSFARPCARPRHDPRTTQAPFQMYQRSTRAASRTATAMFSDEPADVKVIADPFPRSRRRRCGGCLCRYAAVIGDYRGNFGDVFRGDLSTRCHRNPPSNAGARRETRHVEQHPGPRPNSKAAELAIFPACRIAPSPVSTR